MNNTCTEEAEVFHRLLDEKIEDYIREAKVLITESYDEAIEEDQSFMELNSKLLQQKIDRFDTLFEGRGDSEEYNLFYGSLVNAINESFLKGYLVARLGIRANHNPYNWKYLGKKFIGKEEAING